MGPRRATAGKACAGVLRGDGGQSAVLLTGFLLAITAAALALGAVGAGAERAGRAQRGADLAALAGARAMREAYPRVFAYPSSAPGAGPLSRAEYLAIGRTAAERTARENGAGDVAVTFPDAVAGVPLGIRVRVGEDLRVRFGRGEQTTRLQAVAEAELLPVAGASAAGYAAGGGYSGPLAYRQGRPMRPDVAVAFDRLERAARIAGVPLIINSAYRSDAEQAILWAQRPDPRWVAPPGKSLHRNATELDLGPPAAYAWLAANARRFHFVQRYPHEPWHYGYVLNARSRPAVARVARTAEADRGDPAARVDGAPPGHADGARDDVLAGGGALPPFVPERYARVIARAAQRWNVAAALLAAQLRQESGFDPGAQSPAGARGIAQFMPATARSYGLRDPFDADAAIHAQAHLMHDLLRQFGSVPLALAAYNAGPARVAACHCVPAIPETRQYVAAILGLMGGAGELLGAPGEVFAVRLVR